MSFLPVEEARIDKQIGNTAATPGSTSLVSKGAAPAFLGFAVENGAFTETDTNTTATFRGNLVGWLDLLQKKEFLASYNGDHPVVRQLRRVSYSFSLDTTRTANLPAPSTRPSLNALRAQFKQAGRQLANYSVRLALYDQRDPRTKSNRQAIDKFLDKQGVGLLRSTDPFDVVFLSQDYDRWLENLIEELAVPGREREQRRRILYRELENLRLSMLARVPDYDNAVERALGAAQSFDKARLAVFKEMQKKQLLTFEYVNVRYPALPDTSTFRFITEGNVGSTRLDLTANIAWTVQNSGTVLTPEPKKLGGLRNFQAAAQGEMPLGSLSKLGSLGTGLGNPSLAFAYLSQRLTEKSAVSFAGYAFTVDPGWIHVAQAKLTIPVKGSGVKIPLSISIANRTELIREKEIRANFGLTFDLDVLAAGFIKK
jgi:hypothetical protein